MYKGTTPTTKVTRGYNYELKQPVLSGKIREGNKSLLKSNNTKETAMNDDNKSNKGNVLKVSDPIPDIENERYGSVKEPVVRVRMSVEFNFPEANEWLMFFDSDRTEPILQLVPLLVSSLQEIVDAALDATDDEEEYLQFSALDEALDYYTKEMKQ